MSRKRRTRPPSPRRAQARRRRPLLEPLEPRLLLSADLPVLPAEIAAPPSDPIGTAPIESDQATSVVAAETEPRRELVVIDGRLDNADALFADLRSKSTHNVEFDVLLLHDQESGAAQISRALAGYAGDLDALHILSHGSDEGLLLGNDWFTHADLGDPNAGVGTWQRALTDEADLLLYGCNLASTDDGRAFLSDLADLTGADVAASDDLTGGTGSGGDWQLEFQHGRIDTSSALSQAARASFSGTLDGTAIWSENNVATPQTTEYDGSWVNPETNTANIGGPWRTMDGAEAPTRDEKIVVGVDENGDLSGQMWDGTSWTAFAFNDFANVSDVHRWGFAVAYESSSGDAMLVYNNGTTGSNGLSFRTWDGTSWSAETTISTPGFSGEKGHMKLAASPDSDEMVLIATNSFNEDYALVWDGDSWGDGLFLNDGTGAVSNTDISVAYEQQSGDAMVIYGKGDQNAYYRMWNGSSWGGEAGIPAHASVTGVTQWTTAASDPNSDRIIMGALTSDNDVFFSVWDGSAWEAPELATTFGAGTGTYGLAVAFESQSGDAMATYSKFDSSVYYKTWSGGSWSGEAVAWDVGFLNVTSTLTLTSDPGSNRIMAAALDSAFDVTFNLWDGNAWEGVAEVEGAAGTLIGQPFLFLWDQDGGSSGSGESFWISTKDDVTGAGTTGVTAWDRDDVLEISDVQIEPGVSGGNFSIAVNFATGAETNAVHYVSQDMMVAGFQLRAGDLLMSLSSSGTLTSTAPVLDAGFTNSLPQTDHDVFVYRPVAPGDYSDGTFAMLLEDPAGGHDIRGITLVESNTTIGDYTVNAGDFLFTRSGGSEDEDVWLFETATVGSGNTTGTASKLLEGDVFGIDDHLYSIELLEAATVIGGRTFAAGTLLASVNNTDTLGTNNVTVSENDIFALHVTATELGAGVGNSSATAELILEGLDVGLGGSGGERIDAFTLVAASTANTAPTIGGFQAGQTVDDDQTISPFSTVTLDDVDGNALTVKVQLDDGAKGVLTGGGFTDLGGGLYEFSGSAAAAQAAIRALVFDPTDNRVAPGLTETTTFSVTVSDGIDPVANNVTTVISTSVNDPSSIGGTVANQAVNDNASISPFSTVTIADPDVENVTVDVQLDDGAKGVLTGGGFTDLGGGHYQFTGTAAAAQTAIRALVFDPTENRVTPGATETTAFNITVTDAGGPVSNNATSVISTSVNDPSSIGGTVANQAVNDNASISPFGTVTIADPDAENVTVDVQLDDGAKGVLTGGGFTDLGGGHYQFTGTAAAAQTAIRALVFDPTDNRVAPGATETTSFNITVTDAGGPVSNNATTVISTSVNDPSAIGGTVANQAVNDNASISPFGTVTIADPDAENVTVDVQLDDGAKGVLTGGGFTDLGGGHYQFTGTAAAAQTAIRALVFDPTENRVAPGATETTAFNITVTDAGGPVSNNATTVISTSVNDPSSIGGTVSNQAVNDNASISPFGTVTIADPDAENVTVDVQLDDGAKGVLTGGGFTDLGGGHYQFTGTAAAAQTAIRALVFDPTDNRVAPGATETTTFNITVTDAGGPVSNNATTVISTSVNDPSSIGGTVSNQAVNDNASISPFSTVTIADPDAESVVVDVQLDDGAKGVLTGGGFTDLGGGHYQFTGTAAAAQTAIRALVFDPTDNRVAPGLAETTTFSITVTDAGGPVSNNATSVISTSVNDPSSIGGTVANQAVNDNASISPFGTVTIADPDAESVTVDVQLDDGAKGVLTGGGFTDLGGGHYQFTGTAAAAQTAIRALVFDPTDNRVAPGATETTTFNITVTDAGGPVSNNATSVISTSVNDAVTIGGAVTGQTVNDNQTIPPFSTVTISDPDVENIVVEVQLDDAAKGSLSGGGFIDLGSGRYQFTGTAAAAQTAIRALVFDPTENRVAPGLSETTTFSITATDSGGPVFNTMTTVISTSVGDPAVIGGAVAGQNVNDNATIAAFSSVTITEPDGETLTVDVRLDDGAKGVLTGGGFTDMGGGHYQFTGAAAAAQTAIRALVFDPAENRVAPGLTETTQFSITVTDSSGPVINNTTSVVSTSINDPSSIGGTVANQPVNDNATVSPFATVTIADPDVENVIVDVQLDDGAKGVLTGGGFTDLGGGNYQFTGSAAAAQTAIRGLVFDPTDNRVAPGLTETTTFTITVTDVAGPVSNNATTVVSTSVGDPAVIGGVAAGQTVNDNAILAPFSGVTITEPDGEILTVDVRLDTAAKGALSGGGFTDLGGGQYQFTGTAAAAQAAIRALVFAPTENRVAPGLTETTTFAITVTDSSGPVVNNTTSVISTSVNDATIIGGTVAGQPATDNAPMSPFGSVTISDPDAENLTIEVRLDDGAKGTLAGGGFVNMGGGIYEFTGTAAAAEGAIRSLVFTPAANRVQPGLSETTQFTIAAQDTLGGTVSNNATTVVTLSVNDAPTLANASPVLPGITEDAVANGGVTVASILGSSLTDPDVLSAEGIAVTTTNALNGFWQYSTDGGANWNLLAGTSTSAAKLLSATDLVRFRPDGMNAGGGNLAFHGWDQTQGAAGGVADATIRGGQTAFSLGGNVASISTSAVNDAPGAATAGLAPLPNGQANPAGQSIAALLGGAIGDVDAGSSLAGVAVVGNASAAWSGGSWQYTTDGTNWADIGTVGDDASALVLHANTRVRFVPQPGFAGTPPPLVLRAIDNTYSGGFSTTSGGIESRTNCDASIHGGTTAISGAYSRIGTFVANTPTPPPAPPPAPEVSESGGDEAAGEDPGEGPHVTPGPAAAPIASTESAQERLGRGILEDARRDGAEASTAEFHFESTAATVDASATLDVDSPIVQALVEKLIEKVLPEVPLSELLFASAQESVLGELDALRDQFAGSLEIEQTVVGSAFAVTTGLSVGYVVWLTRGGLLLASLVSSMPAWQLMDPTPILASLAGGGMTEDGESLEELLEAEQDEQGPDEEDAERADTTRATT